MKRIAAYCLAGLVALFALSPVLWVLVNTLFVQTVFVRQGGDAPPGFKTGSIREVKTYSKNEVRVRIDADHPVHVKLADGAGRGFARGDGICFSPPPDVLRHEPDSPVTLYRDKPPSRMALWARGRITEIGQGSASIDAELLEDIIVQTDALAGIDVSVDARIHYKPERVFSLVNYSGLMSEVPKFLSELPAWATFGKPQFPKRLGLLFNTILVSLLATAIATVLGTALAVFLTKFPTPFRSAFSWVYVAPLLIPPYISAIAWTMILGEQGTLTKAIQSALGLEHPLFTIYGVPGSALVLALSFFPVVTLMAQAGLKAVDRETEEAALIARGRIRALFSVTLRMCSPHVISGAVFVFVFTLSSSGAPALLRLQLYSSQVMVAFQTDLSGGEAMAAGMPLVLMAAGAVALQGIAHGRARFESGNGRPAMFSMGPAGKTLSLLFCVGLLAMAAGLPLWTLARQAGSASAFKTALTEMQSDIRHSIVFAALAATGACLVGSVAGYLAARVRAGTGLSVLAMIPYAAPASVVGAGLVGIWNRPGTLDFIYVSGAVLALASFTRFIPFAVLPAAAAVRAIDPELEEAAVVHGASRLRATARILLPLGARGFAAGWILVFTLALGELDASVLVAPAGVTTVPIRVFNAIHFGRVEVVSALCLILVVVSAIPLAAWSAITARKMEVI